jgi:hypothetical protein
MRRRSEQPKGGLVADGETAPQSERVADRIDRLQENKFRKGWDSMGGPLPEASALTPEQAAGIAPIPPSDQSSSQSSQDKE